MKLQTVLTFALPGVAAFAGGWAWRSMKSTPAVPGPHAPDSLPAAPATRPAELPSLSPAELDELKTLDASSPPERFLELLPRASAEDIASIARWLNHENQVAWELLLFRWNEVAPSGLASFLRKEKREWARIMCLRLVAESQPEALSFSSPEGIGKTALDRAEYSAPRAMIDILDALLEADPHRALAEWVSLKGKVWMRPESRHFRIIGHRAFLDWAAQQAAFQPKHVAEWRDAALADWLTFDADSARKYAMSLTGPNRMEAISALLHSQVPEDTSAAFAWMNTLPADAISDDARTAVLAELAVQDLDAAISGVRTGLSDQRAQEIAASRLIQRLAEEGDPSALRVLKELPWSVAELGDDKTHYPAPNELRTLFKKWALKDPEAAFAGLDAVPESLRDPMFMYSVFSGWATKSPEEALKAIPRLLAHDPDAQNRQRNNVLADWSDNNPEAALAFILGDTDAASRKEDILLFYDSLGETAHHAERWKYLSRLPVSDLGAEGEQLAAELSTNQPALAAREFAAAPAEWQPVLQCGILRAKVEADATQAPAAAAELLGLAPGLERAWIGQSLEKVAEVWAAADPAAAGDWINALPPEMRNPAVEGLLRGMKEGTDPQGAFAWATILEAPDDQAREHRLDYLKSAYSHLAASDADAARATVLASNLSDAEKQTLLATPPATSAPADQ